MGVPGLLGALKSVTYPIHISQYRGLTVGVDAYCWLHRGAFSCGTELCTGVTTDKYVTFCMKRVNLLRSHEVEPIMVFDGASLPMKGSKHMERRRNRDSARSKGNAALAAGEAGAAAQHFSKAVAVTHEMAFKLIKALRSAGVKLIVAPYEADAQLAYLSRSGAVDVVITEDSDCLPYGCKKVLFKMDNEGLGQEIQLRNLAANTPLSLCNWKNGMFLDLCLLVGCDYMTAAVKGLGIATAHKLVSKHRSLDKIIRAVNASKFTVPAGYWVQYKRARLTFRHHIIYDPKAEETKHLMPLGDTAKEMGDLDFLGCHLPPLVCAGVTSGRLKPTDHQPYERVEPLEPCHPCPAPFVPGKSVGQDISAPFHESAVTEGAVVPELNRKEHTQHFPSHLPAVLSRSGKAQEADAWSGASQARMLSVPSALAGSFIDRPFSANKSALAEMPFSAPEENSRARMGWGAAATDARNVWGLQDMHSSPGVPDFSGGWQGNDLGKAPSTGGGCEPGGMHAETDQSSSFPLGVDSERARLSATQASGLDLTRRLDSDCARLARAFSPATLLAPGDSWPRGSPGESTLLHATGLQNEPQLLPPCTEEGGRRGLALDSGDQSRQEGLTTTEYTGFKSRNMMANYPIRDVGWGGADARERESVWTETCGEKERTDARQNRRRCQTGESADDDRPDRPHGLLGSMGYNPPGVDVAPGLCTSGPEDRGTNGSDGSEVHANNSVEVDTRQAVGVLALTGPPDANRAKFVPSSAQNFHSTQVSPELETLQRRRRRVHAPGAVMLGPPLALGWRGPVKARQQQYERENEEAVDATNFPALEENPPSQTEEVAQLWMVQPDALSQESDSGMPFHRGDGDAADESKGISFFSRGLQHDRALPARRVPTTLSTKQDSAVLPGRHRGANNVRSEARPSVTLSRRWTMPSNLSTTRGAESPLSRLLGATGNSSLHNRQMGRGGSSQRLAKRARGTEFWDAQLMQ